MTYPKLRETGLTSLASDYTGIAELFGKRLPKDLELFRIEDLKQKYYYQMSLLPKVDVISCEDLTALMDLLLQLDLKDFGLEVLSEDSSGLFVKILATKIIHMKTLQRTKICFSSKYIEESEKARLQALENFLKMNYCSGGIFLFSDNSPDWILNLDQVDL